MQHYRLLRRARRCPRRLQFATAYMNDVTILARAADDIGERPWGTLSTILTRHAAGMDVDYWLYDSTMTRFPPYMLMLPDERRTVS